MPKLRVQFPDGPKTHELTEEMITIGRAPDNMVHLDHPSVSGHHAQLQLIGENYHLKDLNSTNGTRVNGREITTVQLRLGDGVRFGKLDTFYESEVEGEAQPLPEAEEIEARPAEVSARPADFANASPFPKRQSEKDPISKAIVAAAVVALLAWAGSIYAVWKMSGPS